MPGGNENKGLISSINLPSIFGGRAGDALSRLIGVPVNAVAARLERGEANTVARTEGQAAFQKIVASAAAQEAIKNPEFMQRAMETFGRDLVEKQINKDRIATQAVLLLDREYDASADDNTIDAENLSVDWLNNFSSHAEKISTEEMQVLWGRLLAGEIRNPGQFSLSTMRILAETDSATAKNFAKYIDHNLGGAFLKKASSDGAIDPALKALEDSGFISGINAIGLQKSYAEKQNGGFIEFYNGHIIKMNCEEDCKKISLPVLMLTRAGKDVLTLTPQKSPIKLAQQIIDLDIKEITNVEVYSAQKLPNNQWRSDQLIGQFKKDS